MSDFAHDDHPLRHYDRTCAACEVERLTAELALEKQCYADVQAECDHWFKAHEEEQIEHDKTRAERDSSIRAEKYQMELIARLEAERDEAINYAKNNELMIAEVIRERDALKKDAERYRWLRTFPNNHTVELYSWSVAPNKPETKINRDKFLDAAIDAAMEKTK